ncbi:MAG: ABC transporter permease, partial [Candidatus Eremiobacteraeota bacterium]|nr:ABC transporter permease [Candidatus Eremiobacteraeota bacterium]
LYARVLFLFLGVPGIVLAILLTIAVTTSGRTRRTREQALLRIRGATSLTLVGLSSIEALVVASGGSAVGSAAFLLLHRHPVRSDLQWLSGAIAAGVILAVGAVVIPAFLQMQMETVRATRNLVGRLAAPLWERLFLDLLLLAIAALAYWQTAASGYQIVLAPEGVPQSTVHYQAFLGPVLFWLGAALLAMRLFRLLLVHAKPAVAWLTKPLAGALAPAVSSTLSRQASLMTRSFVLVLLAFSFGIATAVFNATYNAQALVDAQLTNGADVTVTGQSTASPAQVLGNLRSIPGVITAGAMMHRFAYVGNDLQDLYGINPESIAQVTPMSNAFFGNADAKASLAALAAHPDGVLASEETVTGYQLHLGDQLKLRLQLLPSNRYVSVPFTFIGISREFPTAPHDSFLVTNSAYIARMTHNPAQENVLLKVADGRIPAVAAQARKVVAAMPGARVATILQAQHSIGSTLTSVDLRGLTALELAFAVIFIAAATGLMLALGLAERRRTFAILTAIGARPLQLGAFLWSEALAIVAPGAIVGIALGIGIAEMLVRVLTGVFDPPPERLVYPWAYLALLIAAAVVATGIAIAGAQRLMQASVTTELRRL